MSKTPKEDPDTLRSAQTLNIVEIISEGEIVGLSTGDGRSIFLNETPVLDNNNKPNLSGVDYELKLGTADQSPLAAFPSVESETKIGLEVRKDRPVAPVTIINEYVDRLRVTVGVMSLFETNSKKGDTRGSSVTLAIKINDDVVAQAVIKGKTKTEYLRNYIISNLPAVPFQLTVERITDDSDTQYLSNRTLWASYTEIIDEKFTYPYTAIMGIKFDSEQFSGVPRRNYLIKGRIINIPSNYDPIARTYDGIWDGTFKKAWTDNPAWIYYDLAENKRYSIGERTGGERGIDKWFLYKISQYCDDLVDDGFGGREPRVTANIQFYQPRNAYDVFHDLASMFRGMPIWTGEQISATLDIPSIPVWVYNNANVVDGTFRYQGSALKARHTAIEAEYIDKRDSYKKKIEYVQDDKGIARYGYNVKKIVAFGTNSRGQAHRLAKWIIESERLEREVVEFKTGREGLNHRAGDIIIVADNARAGIKIGGRVASVSSDFRELVLDRELDASIKNGLLTLLNEHGEFEKTQINFIAPDRKSITIQDAITTVKRGSIWTATGGAVRERYFRALTAKDEGNGEFSIVAVEHIPEKNMAIDGGYTFEPGITSVFGGSIPAVEHLKIDASSHDEHWQIRATWDTSRVITELQYRCELFNAQTGTLIIREEVSVQEFTLGELPVGQYTLSIRGINNHGQMGPKLDAPFTIAPPSPPAQLITVSDNFSVTVRPIVMGESLGTIFEFYYGATTEEALSLANYLGQGYILNHQGLKPNTTYYYAVRTINIVGESDFVTTAVTTKLNPEDILDVIGPSIPNLEWAKDLINQVENNSSAVVTLKDRAALVVNSDNRISGITITAESPVSAIDFLADFVSFTDPDSLERNLYWDNKKKVLVVKGQFQLHDGKVIATTEDIRGEKGKPGAGFYRIQTESGTFPADDATVNALFNSKYGRRPRKDDVLTLFSLTADNKVSNRETKVYDGKRWVTAAFILEGNMIAEGSIYGNRLVAGAEISAPIINGGRVIAAEVISSGNPPKFHLTEDGTAVLRGADVSGNLEATSGRFSNVTIEENCTVLGTTYANKLVGDITSVTTPTINIDRKGVSRSWESLFTINCGVSSASKNRTLILHPVPFVGYLSTTSQGLNGYLSWRVVCNGEQVQQGAIYLSARQGQSDVESSNTDIAGYNIGKGEGSISLQVQSDIDGIQISITGVVVAMLAVTGSEFL